MQTFFSEIWTELVAGFEETLGLFSGEAGGLTSGLADLIQRIVVAALLALIFWVVYRALRRAVRLITMRARVPTELSRPLVLALRYTFLVLGALAIMSRFGVSRSFLSDTAVAALFAFLFFLGWLLINRFLGNAVRATGLDRSLEQLLRNVLAVLVASLAFVTIMDQYGVDVLAVITALGVVGIAFGFAAQETLSNFISGITLLIERPFEIGDWVELNGQTGRVELITLRTTRMITRDNIMTSIPNATVASADIVNLSAGGPLRVAALIGIAYKESCERARQVLMPVLSAHPDVMTGGEHSPTVLLEELGDSSVNLTLHYWLQPRHIASQPRISAEILEAGKAALDQHGIEIPFPHLQLFVDEAKGLDAVLAPFRPS